MIEGKDVILLNNSLISTKVASGSENGGNVIINSDTLIEMSSSQISADADNGYGGNITINSDAVFLWSKKRDKALHASSNISGNEGTVTVNSPVQDIAGSLVQLEKGFLSGDQALPQSCTDKRYKKRGSFIIENSEIPLGPDDFIEAQ
ncbi:MAG: hypothetical protein HQK89_04565 [Nitrospirae bacterium]|nr:hypothetical protein [Nitrospirota bacterium]